MAMKKITTNYANNPTFLGSFFFFFQLLESQEP